MVPFDSRPEYILPDEVANSELGLEAFENEELSAIDDLVDSEESLA